MLKISLENSVVSVKFRVVFLLKSDATFKNTQKLSKISACLCNFFAQPYIFKSQTVRTENEKYSNEASECLAEYKDCQGA